MYNRYNSANFTRDLAVCGIFLTTKCSENKEKPAYLVDDKNCPKKRHKYLDKTGK